MSLDMAMFRIALDEDMVTEGALELDAFVEEGVPLLDRIRSYLHGEIERSDVNKEATVSWSKRSQAPHKVIAERTLDVGWACDVGDVFEVVYGGRRASATVVVVEDTQSTVNERPRLWVTVEVRPADGDPFTLRKRFTVSRGTLPRVGDTVEVAYDAADPNDFAYRAAPRVEPDQVEPPSGSVRIAQLKDLAELREVGVLTDAEFEAEKQRVLDS